MLVNQCFVNGISGNPVIHKGYRVDDDGEFEVLVMQDGVEHALCWIGREDLIQMIKELKKTGEDFNA